MTKAQDAVWREEARRAEWSEFSWHAGDFDSGRPRKSLVDLNRTEMVALYRDEAAKVRAACARVAFIRELTAAMPIHKTTVGEAFSDEYLTRLHNSAQRRWIFEKQEDE